MARKNKVQSSGKSPYTKYEKRPYKYSELYTQWKSARKDGNTRLASRLGEQHSARFGMRPNQGYEEAA